MASIKHYVVAHYLDSPEMIATYLTGAFDLEESALIAQETGAVACAQGITGVAENKTGLRIEFKNLAQLLCAHLK
jgi:DNA-binding phage protein